MIWYSIQSDKFKEPDKCKDPIAEQWMGLDRERQGFNGFAEAEGEMELEVTF